MADTAALRAKLEAIRADVDAMLAEIEIAPAEEPSRMRIADYAASRALSYRTVFAMLTEGMPSEGAGQRRRILVREADEWRKGARGRRVAR